jgi:hypothetical protein
MVGQHASRMTVFRNLIPEKPARPTPQTVPSDVVLVSMSRGREMKSSCPQRSHIRIELR